MLRLHVLVYLTPTFDPAGCSGLSCELHLLVHYCVSCKNFSYKNEDTLLTGRLYLFGERLLARGAVEE